MSIIALFNLHNFAKSNVKNMPTMLELRVIPVFICA